MKNLKLKQDALTYIENTGCDQLLLVVKNKATRERHALAGELSLDLILNVFRYDGKKARMKNNFAVYNTLINEFNFVDLGYRYSEELITSMPNANRGQTIEELVCADLNGTQTSHASAFTNGGDIVVNGKHYQVKTHDATLADPKLLRRLEQ